MVPELEPGVAFVAVVVVVVPTIIVVPPVREQFPHRSLSQVSTWGSST